MKITENVTQSRVIDLILELGASGSTPDLDAVLVAGSELQDSRTIDLNGHTLSVMDGSTQFFNINPTTDSEQVQIKAFNVTGSGNESRVRVNTDSETASAQLSVDFNEGVATASISAVAEAVGSTINYGANTHTFTGRVIGIVNTADDFADDAAAATGGIEIGQMYHTAGFVKIRLNGA